MAQRPKSGKYCIHTNANLGYITPLWYVVITCQQAVHTIYRWGTSCSL